MPERWDGVVEALAVLTCSGWLVNSVALAFLFVRQCASESLLGSTGCYSGRTAPMWKTVQ